MPQFVTKKKADGISDAELLMHLCTQGHKSIG